MLAIGILIAALVTYRILIPIIKYLYDAKGLRRYPNFLFGSGISNLPFIMKAHGGFRSKSLREAHIKHPVLRIGPNSLSYGTVKAIKDIYGHGTKCNKDLYYQVNAGSHPNLFDVVDKNDHARKRKIMSSGYALKNLEEWEFRVADLTGRLVKAFDDRCTAPLAPGATVNEKDLTLDYRRWTNLFTISAIIMIGLSDDLGFIDRGDDLIDSQSLDGKIEKHHFQESIFGMQWANSNIIYPYDWYKVLVHLTNMFSSTYRKCWRCAKGCNGIIYNLSTRRLKRWQDGEKLDDFFSALMINKNGKPNQLEWGELFAEVSVMVNAGSDTTAIAISNTMHLLLQNPGCLKKLQEEVDNALDDEIVAPYETVKYLPYLRACIDEGLGMFPPISSPLYRRTPPEGMTILGEFVPGNTSVSMGAYVAHRDPTVFIEPESYKPERWLGEAGKELQPYFIPFSNRRTRLYRTKY